MGNYTKLMYMTFAAIVFCIGIYLMFTMTDTYNDTVNQTREKIKNKELYQQENTKDREIITSGELIASLFYPLEYDIMIDGLLIEKTYYNLDDISGYNIKSCNYKKEYKYDDEGNIVMIIYTSIG